MRLALAPGLPLLSVSVPVGLKLPTAVALSLLISVSEEATTIRTARLASAGTLKERLLPLPAGCCAREASLIWSTPVKESPPLYREYDPLFHVSVSSRYLT